METKKVTEEMRGKLKAPLPAEAIKPHPTKSYLSSIKAIYVTERLNDVFGIGAWRLKVEKESVDPNGMVVVKVAFEIPEYGVYYECFGGNDNGGEKSKNFDLGDAYKGATTDAMTKIGSWMEIGIDVFKGKNTPTNGQEKKDSNGKELKWLNKFTDASKKNLTIEWTNTVNKIKAGTVTLDVVKTVYRLSKEVEKELSEIKVEQAV